MATKPKTFYIFEVPKSKSETDITPGLVYRDMIRGDVSEARDSINGDAYQDGMYLVLEDTSGYITKATEHMTKVRVSFDPPRKKERKPRADVVTQTDAKKRAPRLSKLIDARDAIATTPADKKAGA